MLSSVTCRVGNSEDVYLITFAFVTKQQHKRRLQMQNISQVNGIRMCTEPRLSLFTYFEVKE